MKLPYIGFGGALVITELIILIAFLSLGVTVSSCSEWWVIISCSDSLAWLGYLGLGIGYLLWKIFRDGHSSHEETLQAPRQSVQNPHFH